MFKRSLLAGLSRREKNNRKETDLCRPPTRSFMQPPTKFVAETYWFLKPVSFNVGCRLRLHANISEPTVVRTQTGFVGCVARD